MIRFLCHFRFLLVAALSGYSVAAETPEQIRALIVDGRNNHDWEITTDALRATLESTGRFAVSVSTAPELKIPNGPRNPNSKDESVQQAFDQYRKSYEELTGPVQEAFPAEWQLWQPAFGDYEVVILNYNGPDWPEAMRKSFVEYVKSGGGVFLVHAANNAFRNWEEFNEMIGMGWRPAPSGKAIKVNAGTGAPYWDKEAGNSGHGSKHAFAVTVRAPGHPVMKGLPAVWMHGKDELYHDMRGPAQKLTILSSAFSDPAQRGTGKHEPITWEVEYGEGKAIVTSMGHFWKGQEEWDGLHCVGFQTIVNRSCEYLATGEVTIPVPSEFPGEEEVSAVTPGAVNWGAEEEESSRVIAWSDYSYLPKKKENPYVALTPEEELQTFDLAPGYVAELVAAEPDVEEPVLTVFDGNGVIYVAEMRSYMQDVEGTGTKTAKNGRIKRLEDTDGDGRVDRVTVFVDNLNLPRAILPLDDRIAVRETDTMDIVSYRDTDGDGVADEKELLYERGPYGRGNVGTSVEHQDSGLIWNIDNHIYLSYNIERYRFTDGTWTPESQRGHWTQWGLTHNDVGDLYWIHNSDPVAFPYLSPHYWETVKERAGKEIHGVPIDMGKPYGPDFLKVKSHCLLNDRGGPAAEVRSFTSACGQTIFRGHKLPRSDYGAHFFCDPTIHVVRRSDITKKGGLDFFEKAEPGDAEFLRSSDINSRFVNTATGPDGCLYVTDMYRGIIQDAPWLSPEPRKNIVANGLDKNIRMGRIWRVRHEDYEPGARPRMIGESTVSLVRHLEHPNGWWRDTAQRMIILREDRETVVPLLKGIAQFSQNALGRLHALWTLEGIGVLDLSFVSDRYADRDPRVRRAAVQIAERWIEEPGAIDGLRVFEKERDEIVAQQVVLSLGKVSGESRGKADELIQAIAENHLQSRSMILAAGVSLWGGKDLPLVEKLKSGDGIDPGVAASWKVALANWNRGIEFPKEMPDDHRRLVRDGEVLYFQSCVACHGADGKGLEVPGTDLFLAPSLADSPRVHGSKEQLVPILLHGLTGPLDGKTYQAGFMAPGAALGLTRERDFAQVLSYLRFAWDRKSGPITEEDVKKIKAATSDRALPWTQEELEKLEPGTQ
jgi:mono/diheme cytochrome c family protein/glucose/arabinose dehydrogenase/type 1 glutamine amidotransferase